MLTALAAPIGLILTAFALLQQLAFWQRKEYRADRAWADLDLARRTRKTMAAAGALAVATLFSFTVANGWPGLIALAAVFAYHLRQRGLSRPQPTQKAAVIGGMAVILLIFVAWSIASRPASVAWLIVCLATLPAVALATAIGNWLGNIQKQRIIAAATRYRATLSGLTVIGVTGSFGKTSAKYFVHHLMSGAGRTIAMSTERRNEAFVVAQDMVEKVNTNTNAYIVEMGAYRRGEIARIAAVAQPKIAVVTAIGNQHVALFGSREALAAAKWELVLCLPTDGTAVLNADDSTIVAKARGWDGHIVWYSLKEQRDAWAEHIAYAAATSSFDLHLGQNHAHITIPLPAEGYAQAAVAAAAAAYAAGTPTDHIFSRLSSLTPIPQTMAISTNSRGATIIDDSYSANEAGVLMAIRHLARFPHTKKVVVLRPLIELGAETERIHRAIGQALAESQAAVFLYDMPGAVDIEAAMSSHTLCRRIASPKALAKAVGKAVTGEVVCLLENRLPDIVRQAALA